MHKLKILFVDFSQNIFDKHPIYSLSSVLKKEGHLPQYVKYTSKQIIIEKINSFQPDLVLYSCFSSEIPQSIECDELIKSLHNCKSVIGGPGPTFDRSQIKSSSIDAICVGEGEIALINYINNGMKPIQNIIAPDYNGIIQYAPLVDLNKAPFPDRSIIYEEDIFLKDMPSKQFMAGRGCPYNCSYCHNHAFLEIAKDLGPKFRFKEVDYLIEEILEVKNKYGLENVVFQDDVFILNKKWIKEFCEKFKERVGIKFTCNIRANLINDEIISIMKDAGCAGVSWSIESGNDFIRNKILSRNMSKRVILRAAEILNRHGIPHRTGNIVGIPGESFDEMIETLELNIDIKPFLAMAYTFVPFPGLELTKYAVANGHLEKNKTSLLPRSFFKESILNFSQSEKSKISKISLIFPFLVRYPYFYKNKTFFNLLLSLPIQVLKPIYHYMNVIYSSKMFKVEMKFFQKLRGLPRYLSSGM